MDCLLSVIVPIYNESENLHRCIQSILCQTYKKLQIILVDDGSTDDSGIICDGYAETDDRIEVIHQPNGGLVAARKAGLKKAVGEYIGFVDSDDYLEPEFYDFLISRIIETQADFIHSGYIEEQGKRSIVERPERERYYTQKDDIINFLAEKVIMIKEKEQSMTPSIWSKVFRTSFLKECYKIVPEYIAFGEDMVSLCQCILNSRCFGIIPYAGYHYVFFENSLSHRWSLDRFAEECLLYSELKKVFKENHVENEMRESIDSMLKLRMISCMNNAYAGRMYVPVYLYPDISGIRGKKILLYGAGTVGKSYFSQMRMDLECRIEAWIDKKFNDSNKGFYKGIEAILELEYDLIIVAVKKESLAKEIISELTAMGVDKDKISWREPAPNI